MSEDQNINTRSPSTKPLVSVLIPCHNSAPYIAETLDSVIAQTYTNWECIVVDDHSTDNSMEIVEKYCQQHPDKIKLYTNPRKGACAARNFAFEKSKGYYIQYLDADDIINPDKLKNQTELLQKSPHHVAVCNTWHFYNTIEEAHNTDKDFIFSTDDPAGFLINLWGGAGKTHYTALHSWLTPRHLIKQSGSWDEELLKDQDGEFFARVLLNSNGIVYTPEAKSYYRKHVSGSNIASKKQQPHIESNLKSTQLKEQYLLETTNTPRARKAIATQYKHVAIEAWPQFRDISTVALKKCKQLGGSGYLPVLGGKTIEFIKKTMGWKIAKSISYYGHQSKTMKYLFSKVKH